MSSFRASLRAGVALAIALVAVTSCGASDDGGGGVLSEPIVGGDLILFMQPGDGPGVMADQLAGHWVRLTEIPVKEGTPDHLAWFDRTTGPDESWFMKDAGPVHVFSFTADRENPRGGDPEFCLMFGGGGGCAPGIDQPQIHSSDRGPLGGYLAQAFGGADAAEAVILTESGKTISILAAAGYVHAEWPDEWGPPQTVSFYDREGSRALELPFAPQPHG